VWLLSRGTPPSPSCLKTTAENYDEKYATPNYFRDRRWLYKPFIKALAAKAGLKAGARLLDAGCGQGFFTNLFAEVGFDALGVDLSSVGIAAAQRTYTHPGVRFEVGDILQLQNLEKFDCVFTRSCSLYNNTSFAGQARVTDTLYSYVRPRGVLIFDYYTRLQPGKSSVTWIYHSITDARKHFAHYPQAKVYFSLRLETPCLGRFALSALNSRLCQTISALADVGGELVVLVRKEGSGS
jgi:SAM-dependent methyltransferase